MVGFVFSDESGKKRRPAVVVSSAAYHRSRDEVIVGAITSNVHRVRVGDQPIENWREAGLLFPSLATGIVRTIKREMIECRLGELKSSDLDAYSASLRRALDL
ncbi:MAG: type II toxin-antitoxin system PemK/MazF family toxin [Myxococcales bacterium]|nr:type II toxin-antitoxin system PemK/MazF family toxin [Myxococcales bacterium]